MRAIADTGFIVAALVSSDRYHGWARELASQASEPFLTCEAVLAEAAFNVKNVAAVLGLLDTKRK